MRSKLFVPASRPELFEKAMASAADAISFDLEDAVSPERKPQAREALRELLNSGKTSQSAKVLIVRVNPVNSAFFLDDILATVQPGLQLINLPKPESVEDVHIAVEALERAEQRNGVTTPVRLLLNIESPRAFRYAAELAGAHSRVAGLQLGLGDLFEPLGITRSQLAAMTQAMFGLRMAAGEAGVFAYDAAFADIKDTAGFRAEALLARDLGFMGKSCIHPSQIALANDVFQSSEEDIAHAMRVVIAASQADAQGVAAYVVDGRMIDPPFAARARTIVRDARMQALLTSAQEAALENSRIGRGL
jgi:citrate lyase subunit beta/citryl-CoA lyase